MGFANHRTFVLDNFIHSVFNQRSQVMSNQQNAVNLLREQYKESFNWLQGTMQEVTDEVAHKVLGERVATIAGHAAHAVSGLDFLILATVAGRAPLMMSSFQGKSGISEPPPQGQDWLAWGQCVKLDLPAFHAYATAVFQAVDEYLASLHDDDLPVEIETAFGKQTKGWWFNIMELNTYSHTGEIACLKGLQGLKGYPV
jgi:hypothetical protein